MIDLPRLAQKLWPHLQTPVDDRIRQLRTSPTQHDAYGVYVLTVEESDGSPSGIGIDKIVVSDGTLSVSGRTATITTGGGGGGDHGYTWHVNSFDLDVGTLAAKIPVIGSQTFNKIAYRTTSAQISVDVLLNGSSIGTASISGNGSSGLSGSGSEGDTLSIDITAVTVYDDVTMVVY